MNYFKLDAKPFYNLFKVKIFCHKLPVDITYTIYVPLQDEFIFLSLFLIVHFMK